jgi:8-oxo-dGTP diphosphatase
MSYTYDFERPMVTADCIIINHSNHVLLIKRKNDPFAGSWAFPGGFVEMDEDIEESAVRELEEETSLTGIVLQQFKTYGKPGRDPRGRTITVVFYGDAPDEIHFRANDDAAEAAWFHIHSLPSLAFDHGDIFQEFLLFRDKKK